MVPAASVDSTKPGFRVKSYQSPHDNPNHLSWTEQQLQGLHGPNVADQQNTNGPGYFVFGADNLGSEGDGVLDLINNNGGIGEWSYQKPLDALFGLGENAGLPELALAATGSMLPPTSPRVPRWTSVRGWSSRLRALT
jgi:hypothetical protein